MIFNSLDFALFLPIVFLLYWIVPAKKISWQNTLLLGASYIFYGWWDWRFLSLIVFSSLVDFLVGISLKHEEQRSKRLLLLVISIVVNLGFLGFFKYYNFFAESFADAFSIFGQKFTPDRLDLVLPVGISFYTFQTLSYSIDVYRRKMEPTTNPIDFFTYVSFFPQLVAGPIERATNLLPQFRVKRVFKYEQATDGMRQILWGLFKKMVIADNCAIIVDEVFIGYENLSGPVLVLGAVLFAFQIYCDFSGYSDIAIGSARLFGFELNRNFAFPYFSRDIAEFWRRWHISLSTWFRDYLYIPLGGSKGGTRMQIRNTFIIFVVSGFWHGANWTFIFWGAFNALLFLPLLLSGKNRVNIDEISSGRIFPSLRDVSGIVLTFALTCLAWVFFRAPDLTVAFDYIGGMFDLSDTGIHFAKNHLIDYWIVAIPILFVVEWTQRDRQHALDFYKSRPPKVIRWGVYYALLAMILSFRGDGQEFIYFQF